MAATQSPSSSPRLPSPPPIAEDQIGPTSPGVSLYEEHGKFPGVHNIDTGAARRIRPGTKAEDMAEGPPLVELHDIDSAFQLTEHLKALHWHYTHPPDSDTVQPIDADIAQKLTAPPPNTSRDIWLYELGRFLIQKTNAIIVALFADDPPCSSTSCPEMRASEWQYLCAVHDPPKSCAAVDYCCHTLDWASNSLASSKLFPSRLGLGSGTGGNLMGNDKHLLNQMKEIKNIFRRVYRIYAHAWFQHREMFWRVENKTGLYVFFKTVCDGYGIIEPENYTIPAEAEGYEPETPHAREVVSDPITRVLHRGEEEKLEAAAGGNDTIGIGDTTKRHRHTRSDLSASKENIIQEEAEEEDQGLSSDPAPPPLGRQVTALKDEDENETDVQSAEERNRPGMLRTDTLKPNAPHAAGEEGSPLVDNNTPVEAVRQAATEPNAIEEQAPADAEEASQTVGD